MKYAELVKRLRAAGFTSRQGKGDHEVWSYPGIPRPVVITQTREVSPAVTANALKAIARKEK
ncbi:type II toxin-antitoxin system HicA family toxin [Kocuria palustris]|uniref:type II toxin-antitoxin system HicA family toxin n=1 Tax=Kocuria palustris TaxID=71999 RepID=UPI0019CF96A6|nr:type II toxin-antitoxin system HicA family toxin [Kocuria palustris]